MMTQTMQKPSFLGLQSNKWKSSWERNRMKRVKSVLINCISDRYHVNSYHIQEHVFQMSF